MAPDVGADYDEGGTDAPLHRLELLERGIIRRGNLAFPRLAAASDVEGVVVTDAAGCHSKVCAAPPPRRPEIAAIMSRANSSHRFSRDFCFSSIVGFAEFVIDAQDGGREGQELGNS